jgi:mono/diheme cytochrome c family protein
MRASSASLRKLSCTVAASLLVLVAGAVPEVAVAQGTEGASASRAAPGTVTFAKDIAPILQQNCQGCHRPEGVGPMSFVTYEEVRPWARVIKDRVTKRRMPPWGLDPTVGIQEFKEDISLSEAQIAMIGRWVDEGAPLGNPADLPPPRVFSDRLDSWVYEDRFGRAPDLVIRNPAFKLHAQGLDQWPDLDGGTFAEAGLERERWMMAIEARPSTRETRYVFHHGGPSGLMNSPAGKVGEILPEDSGKLLKPDDIIRFSLHLFPIGQEVDVVMEWGIWLYPEDVLPKYTTRGEIQVASHHGTQGTLRAHDMVIPPGSTAMLRGVRVLDEPTRIHSIRAHMHLRGTYQTIEAIYPDGQREVLNKINFDHLWHTVFTYEDHARPLLPKGTVLITTTWFDNTLAHRHNPDPNQWVTYGQRSVDDMAHMWVGMTSIPEEDFAVMVAEREQFLEEMEYDRAGDR